MFRLILSLVAVCLLATSATAAIAADKITNIPFLDTKYGSPTWDMYSGYITVDESHGRALFYWFTESKRNPSTDPLVLWLNGGPGCSSLDGFFYEHGPLHFDRDNTNEHYDNQPHLHPYAWSNITNMIYLESPAGVGFSYSNDSRDYNTNDNKTAVDAYNFLVNWLQAYPEYQNSDFYIAGESYAGIYVPTLAYYIHEQNQVSSFKINLKGIAVGNGVTANYGGRSADPQFFHGHAILKNQTYYDMVDQDCFYSHTLSHECETYFDEMYKASGHLNEYDIYHPCYHGPNHNISSDKLYHPLRYRPEGVKPLPEATPGCVNAFAVDEYLNDVTVRQALHAKPESEIGRWSICSNKVRYETLYSTMLPAYQVLTQNYRVLVYSGDADTVIPWTYTSLWLNAFVEQNGLTAEVDFEPWFTYQACVHNTSDSCMREQAGMATVWKGANPIMWAVVKGAGHMVPQYKPAAAYTMFTSFVDGTFPPTHF